ncbi:hypothetical protein Tco_0799332 [Tanacetum coccineum]|uniref:Uncharacterized protein n=1 Tax=Tanacetum coccineum TaxID=301880 RepID=A0ABQ4ZQ31_9ASTR
MLWTLILGDDSTHDFEIVGFGDDSAHECEASGLGSCVSLLLIPLCCDGTHEVTHIVSAMAGCDRLVSELLVIENYVSLIRKKFRWEAIFLIGLKRYRDPKEEPIEKEPLVELKEIG